MGVCRKNAPLVKAAIQLLVAGKPAKIKDKNIGGRLVARVKDICQKQRVRYNLETFIKVSVDYEQTQIRRLQDFPNSENQINDLADMLEAIRALFQAYEPDTFKAWEKIVEKIFDESGYSPISLYTIHSGKGGEGQVSFIIYPEDLPLIHPKQVEQEREQEDHLLYVALTRTLADGAEGSGILYLVCREASSADDDEDKDKDKIHIVKEQVKYPNWLPKKYCQLWKWGESEQPDNNEVESVCLDTPKMETLEKCLDTTLPDLFTSGSNQQKYIAINVPQIKPYERVVTSRPVTFTCQYCGEILTQLRMPGPLPTYCSERCRLDAAATRKKAVRAVTGKNKGKRGRPKESE